MHTHYVQYEGKSKDWTCKNNDVHNHSLHLLGVLLLLHPHPSCLTAPYFSCHHHCLCLHTAASCLKRFFTGIVLHMVSNESPDLDSITVCYFNLSDCLPKLPFRGNTSPHI